MSPAVTDEIQRAIVSFHQNGIASRRRLTEAYATEPEGFLVRCLPAIRGKVESPGGEFLVTFLLGHSLLESAICDARMLTPEDAAAAMRIAKRIDPSFEVRLLRSLGADPGRIHSLHRLLEVLDLSVHSSRLVPVLSGMMNHSDPFVRSKVALLMGRLNQSAEWVRERLSDPDARVRANAVEALWGETGEECQKLFREAAANPSNRVAGNGVIGLYLAGDPESLEMLLAMSAHRSPLFQVTAYWAMGCVGDPRFLPHLVEGMGKADESLRHHIFEAIRRVRYRRDQIASLGTLRVYLSSATSAPNAGRVLRFAVFDPIRREVLDGERLRATHVIVSEEGHATFRYSLVPASVPETISVGFVFPTSEAGSADFAVVAQTTVDQLESVRRAGDRWIRAPYSAAVTTSTLESTLKAVGDSDGERHLILAGPSEAPLGIADPAALIRIARSHRIRVHTILSESAPAKDLLQSEALARESGGFALRYAAADTFVRHVELILASVLGPFELHYSMPEGQDVDFAEVRLQVLGPRGHGEVAGFIKPNEEQSSRREHSEEAVPA